MRKPIKLTQTMVDTMKVSAGKVEDTIADAAAPGLKLRIRREGARVYIFQRRFAGQHPKITIGDAATWSLEQARRRARELAVSMDNGVDPRVAKAERIAATKATFESIMHGYLEARARDLKPRSLEETTRHLQQQSKPLHKLPIAGIARATIAARLREIATGSGPVAADRLRSSLSAMFSWAIGEGLCELNPVIGTNRNSDDAERERTLTDTELVKVWNAVPADSHYGAIVRLLILTGARRNEIASLRWSEIDRKARTLTLPGERTKNGRAFTLPLSDLAMKVIDSIGEREGRDLVFGSAPGRGFSGWSHCKKDLDQTLELEPWRLHDLRRTLRTGLGKLGVAPHVAEACLNHLPAKLVRTYDKNKYESEKRQAFDRWSEYVSALVAGKRSNVVALKDSAPDIMNRPIRRLLLRAGPDPSHRIAPNGKGCRAS
jgi:integrase